MAKKGRRPQKVARLSGMTDMKRPQNIYLIDGNSYVYRAYHAIKELRNSRGFPTNAVYGFTNMLLKVLREKSPDAIVIAFDSPLPTKRHRAYEEYKAQRPETPNDLIVQIPYIRKVIDALRIKTSEMPGYEADDVLATLAVRAASQGVDAYIVTGDKDMLQVLNGHIVVYDPMKEVIIKRDDVLKRFGVPPERIPEVMALTGDTVDNIPGVKGIGEKTAGEILREASLIDILKRPDLIKKERLRRMITEGRDSIIMSLSLARVETDVPVQLDIDECTLREPDNQELLNIFRDLEFGTLTRMIPASRTDGQRRVILDLKSLGEVLSAPSDIIYIDTFSETESSLDTVFTGIALSLNGDTSYYIPLRHRYLGAPVQPEVGDVLELLRPVIEDGSVRKTGYDLKRDITRLSRCGIKTEGQLLDVMVLSYILNPGRPNQNLDEIALDYLSIRKPAMKELLGMRRSILEVDVDDVAGFAASEASVVLRLQELLFRRLREEGLYELYTGMEMPLIGVLSRMEERGIRVDTSILRDISMEIDKRLSALQSRIYELAGGEFNINSPKQLSRVLFQSIGLKPIKRTKSGYSTEVGVLEELAKEHDLPREVLNWRTLSKLKSTYVDVLPTLINPETGRIHTTFNQAVTATGRLSSSDPNLQNIPIRGEWGRRIREAFVSEDGYVLLSADYSQIELRLLAHLSGDAGLIEAFRNGVDIHKRTAMELFNLPGEEITQDMRRVAKTVNFGVVYGISSYGLSEATGSSREDAELYIEQYFMRHPGVREYTERIVKEAGNIGYVRTLFGRKRMIPELRSSNAKQRSLGERLAVNTPIQGSAADIIKKAMISIDRRLREEGIESRMVLQVHDELLFEVREGELMTVGEMVRHEMENVVALSVPVRVDIGYGRNWADAHG